MLMQKLVLFLSVLLLVSCEKESKLDNSNFPLPEGIEGCYVENFNGWSEGVLGADGTTFLLKNSESTDQTERAFMFLPDEESGIITSYMEFDENSVPTFMAFNDTRVYIRDYTDETISFVIVYADTLMYMVDEYEHHRNLISNKNINTRAWEDNNWIRNTVAVGEIIIGVIEIGGGVTLTVSSALTTLPSGGISIIGVGSGIATIHGGASSLISGLNKITASTDAYIKDPTATEMMEDYTYNVLKFKLGLDDMPGATFWAGLTLSVIDEKWGKTEILENDLIDTYGKYKVITGRFENVGYSSATLYGYVSPVPDVVSAEYGIVVYETEDESNKQYKNSLSQAGGLFNFTFEDLKEDTEYSYFTYFFDKTNSIGIFGIPQIFWTGHNQEREVLCALYESTNGDGWNNNTNWCTEAPLDEWYGIMLNEEGYVESIDLYDNNLRGEVSIYGLYYLKNLYLSSNYLTGLYVISDVQIEDIALDNCIVQYGRVSLDYIDNVLISNNEAIGGVSCGKTQELEISNCNFGDNSVLRGKVTSLLISNCSMHSVDGEAQEATIFNCKMHHCGINSEILNFNYSSTYDTWHAHTTKQLNITESYCSTICGGDFEANTVIHLQNTTLWRSNWNEDSLVTLSCTITGAQWDSLFEGSILTNR